VNLLVPLAEQERLLPLPAEGEEGGEQQDEEVKEEATGLLPGNVLTNKVLIVPPRTEKRFHAAVTGLPRLGKFYIVLIF
jgi:hypothetical protein